MFHLADNLYFGRIPDKKDHEASIRILAFKTWDANNWPTIDGIYPDAILDIMTTASAFASVVSSLSKTGENGETWQKALDILNQ